MAGINQSLDIIAGFVPANATVFGSTTLSTTPVKATLCTARMGRVRRVRIVNLTATTNRVSFTTVAEGAAAPTLSADPASANAGVILAPLQEIFLVLPSGIDLYVVGSAANTAYQVASFNV